MPSLRGQDASVALRGKNVDDQTFVRPKAIHRLLEHESIEVSLWHKRVSQEVPGIQRDTRSVRRNVSSTDVDR